MLGAAGVVIGLLGFAVFVDGACALAEQVKDFAEIDVAPDFGPLLGGLRNGLQGVAEGVGGGLVILLVEEGLLRRRHLRRSPRLRRTARSSRRATSSSNERPARPKKAHRPRPQLSPVAVAQPFLAVRRHTYACRCPSAMYE